MTSRFFDAVVDVLAAVILAVALRAVFDAPVWAAVGFGYLSLYIHRLSSSAGLRK